MISLRDSRRGTSRLRGFEAWKHRGFLTCKYGSPKTFFYKNHICWNEFQDVHCVRTPEGRKSDALYHWVWWTLFRCSLDIFTKTFFYKNHSCWNEFQDVHCVKTPEGRKSDALYHWVRWTLFRCLLIILAKRFS